MARMTYPKWYILLGFFLLTAAGLIVLMVGGIFQGIPEIYDELIVVNRSTDTVCVIVRCEDSITEIESIERYDIQFDDSFDEAGNPKHWNPEGYVEPKSVVLLSLSFDKYNYIKSCDGNGLYLYIIDYKDVISYNWGQLLEKYATYQPEFMSLEYLEESKWNISVERGRVVGNALDMNSN